MSLGDVLDLTPRGFTGHEHVDHAGVIHMNGRIYDPTLGRFLQADPFIQAPKNSQSYNRYRYVLNSPLSYTDPSGYNFFKSFVKFDGFLAGAFGGGGIVGGAIQSSINHNIHKWVANSQGLTATAGVVIGAFTSWWCGPCSIGFSALFTSNIASYNGASSSEAFHAGGRTAATAGVFYGIGQAFNGQGHAFWETGSAQHIAAHAIAGGIISDLQGGNFGHGFFSAGVTKYAGGYLPSGDLSAGQIIGGTIASAIIGGTASKISGGKFANGARTAAFQYLFNQATQWASREIAVKRALRNLRTTYENCNALGSASCSRTSLGTYVYNHEGGKKYFGLVDDPAKGFSAELKVNANGARFYALNTNANAGSLPLPSCGSNCSVSDWFLAIDPGSGTPNYNYYQSNFNINSIYIWNVGNSTLTHHTYDSGQWNKTVTGNWGG